MLIAVSMNLSQSTTAGVDDPYASGREGRALRETAHIHPSTKGDKGHGHHGGHGHHAAHGHHHGNSSMLHSAALANKTIYGALIHTVRDKVANAIQKKYYDSRRPPFPLAAWPYTRVKSCPGRNGRAPWLTDEEKSMATAHMQAWLEFTFFDHDVLKARERGAHSNGPYYSTWYSSNSGNYTLAADGSLHKHGLPFLETDVMVMIEDSAEIALLDERVTAAIMTAVADIGSADLLFLGRCEADRLKRDKKTASSSSSNMSSTVMCSNAYAITRRGARQLIAHYDPCGRTLDELMESLLQRDVLAHRVGSLFSPAENLYKKGFAPPVDHRYYIFHTRL